MLHIGDMEATDVTTALNQGENGRLADRAMASMLALLSVLDLLPAADVGYVHFGDTSGAANRTISLVVGSMARPVKQEPSRLIVCAQQAMQFMRTEALLARRISCAARTRRRGPGSGRSCPCRP